VIEYVRADWIRNLVQEFQAPTFRSEGQFQYEALLIIGVIICGLLLRRRRIVEALWILFLAHASLVSVRHVPIFAVVAAPIIATELSTLWSSYAGTAGKASIAGILHQLGNDIVPSFRWLSVWPAIVIVGLALIDEPVKWPHDFPSEAFPVSMVHTHRDLLEQGRLLTVDQWADYLIFCNYPRQRVFVDGRSDFYGESLGREYLHLLQGAYDWKQIMAKYSFDRVLIPVDWPLASILKLDSSWRVVVDDGKAMLFLRLDREGHRN